MNGKSKALLASVLLFVSLSFLWSTAPEADATVGYVYGNLVSSMDFKTTPKVGTEFRDSNNNVLIVSKNVGNAVVFDRMSTLSPIEEGDALIYDGRQHTVFARLSLTSAMVGYSVSTALHPVRPIAMAGFSFSSPLASSLLATATSTASYAASSSSFAVKDVFVVVGLETDVVFSKLWDSSLTFIEDGGVLGWCALGASVHPSLAFACSYGMSYRHFIGPFRWEIGFSWLRVVGSGVQRSSRTPFVGMGVAV